MKKNGKILLAMSHIFGDGVDMSEVITGVLTTLYKWDDAKVTELLKDGATPATVLKAITDADKERVKTLTTGTDTAKFQEGYKKAKKEVLTEYEKALKAEFEYEGDETGNELVTAIVAKSAKTTPGTTEEDVKKSPVYLQMEKKMKKELADLKVASDTKIKEIEGGYAKKETLTKIGAKALAILTGLNPVLPTKATVAEKQKQLFLNEFNQYEFEEKDGQTIVLKDGKVVTDAHGHTLEFEALAKNIAGETFEFAANNGGANGGNNNNNGGGAAGAPAAYPPGVVRPKNIAELTKVVNDPKLKGPEKQIVMDTYEKEYGGK